MPQVLNFYIDDSGTRHPDKRPAHTDQRDWFALGGILIRECDEGVPRIRYEQFCHQWGIKYPLHSYEIRQHTRNFQWLSRLPELEHDRFFRQLERLILSMPVLGLACVIDRPGYNARYREKYGRERWSLCKSAFSIVVERAAKYARSEKLKLRVLPERSNPEDEEKLKEYYDDMRKSATPFDPDTSNKYSPLSAENLRETLYEFKPKAKSSPMMQIADLCLWPMCVGGYDAAYEPYRKLLAYRRLLDCLCRPEDVEALGVKYYCFDSVKRKA